MRSKEISPSYGGANLVFVVGCPRSGTTYLQRLLAAHPKIKTGQESHLFYLVGPLVLRWRAQVRAIDNDPRGGVGLPCYLNEAEFHEILQDFVLQLLEPMTRVIKDDELFVEKSPSHALYIDVINPLLPEARFIHLMRDARDVVASLLAASRSWGKHWASKRATEAARLWCKHVISAKQSAQQIDPSLFYELKYEDVVADPIDSLLGLSAFLELDWPADSLERAMKENRIDVAKKTGGTPIPVGGLAAQRRNAVVKEPNGFIREGGTGNWKMDLTSLEKFQVWRVARATMKSVGYDWKYPF